MTYVVHYHCGNRLFTTLPYTLEQANSMAQHLEECGFEGVFVQMYQGAK